MNNNNLNRNGYKDQSSQNKSQQPRTRNSKGYSTSPNRQSVPYPPVKHKSRAQARAAAITTVVIALILFLLLGSMVYLIARYVVETEREKDAISDALQTDAASSYETDSSGAIISPIVGGDDPEQENQPGNEQADENNRKEISEQYHEIDVLTSSYTAGNLILVNDDYAYNFDNELDLVVGYNVKKRNFYVFDTTKKLDRTAIYAFKDLTDALYAETGINDVLITEGYRTYEYQKAIFDPKAYEIGEEGAKLTIAVPGHSEHHSGLAMDLSVFGDGRSFSNLPEYPEWFDANAHKYGYILRYAEDKTEITKISYEYWHYRYVGVPHAYYMKVNNLCLEEYTELLIKYDYYTPLVFTDDQGIKWEIYHTACGEGESTKVIVPKEGEYRISGNNVDGFIVTVKLTAEV